MDALKSPREEVEKSKNKPGMPESYADPHAATAKKISNFSKGVSTAARNDW